MGEEATPTIRSTTAERRFGIWQRWQAKWKTWNFNLTSLKRPCAQPAEPSGGVINPASTVLAILLPHHISKSLTRCWGFFKIKDNLNVGIFLPFLPCVQYYTQLSVNHSVVSASHALATCSDSVPDKIQPTFCDLVARPPPLTYSPKHSGPLTALNLPTTMYSSMANHTLVI